MIPKKFLRFLYVIAAIVAIMFLTRMMKLLNTSSVPEELIYYHGVSGRLYTNADSSSWNPLIELTPSRRLILLQNTGQWCEVTDGTFSGWLPLAEVGKTP
jgi:hypothetical protein